MMAVSRFVRLSFLERSELLVALRALEEMFVARRVQRLASLRLSS